MKKILLFTLAGLFFAFFTAAQQPQYSRIKISPDPGLFQLAKIGLPVENGEYRPGKYFITEYSIDELKKLDSAGVSYQVLINDIAGYYAARNKNLDKEAIEARMRSRDRQRTYPTPQNFTLGSMGGYHTNSEVMEELDEMRELFPELITEKQAISTTLETHEGRPVYWVRISNNPDETQEKPRVLYTSLTHAREPASMQQMLFQMWYLLENYGVDPEITYIVDNIEMYFVPVVNPDGYIYNETTDPNGGGMFRKNRRQNPYNTWGVDLNRNYGYQWGYDDSGSSPSSGSDTYRGPFAFSEPETQMIKEFAETYNFQLALNHHTYSDLLIYPWGYTNQLTPDGDVFVEFAKLLTRENHFTYGTVFQTLYYFSNGSADDWFYGEQSSKEKVFSFTPESGKTSDGFWPAMDRIEDICERNFDMNLFLARLALPYAELKSTTDIATEEHEFYYSFEIRSLGLDTMVTYTVSVNPISDLIAQSGPSVAIENMGLLETAEDSVFIKLHEFAYDGLSFDFEVVLDNGQFQWRDTVEMVVGTGGNIVYDDFQDNQMWESSAWGLTTEHNYSEPYSMTDSPEMNYPDNTSSSVILKDTVDLSGYSSAFVTFNARWNTEKHYDYVQFKVSEDFGQTWVPLQGNYTSFMSSDFPVYHGMNLDWVKERISLDNFIGKEVILGFFFFSDSSINHDGFYFDDFMVSGHKYFEMVPPQVTGQQEVELLAGNSLQMQPQLLEVHDEFFSYPQYHTINLFEGDHYSLDGNVIVPESDFLGEISVRLTVENGLMESDPFDFVISCVESLSACLPAAKAPDINYNRQLKQLMIDPGTPLEGKFLFSLYDAFGMEILRQDIYFENAGVIIPVDLKPGIYVYSLRGKSFFSGKISSF